MQESKWDFKKKTELKFSSLTMARKMSYFNYFLSIAISLFIPVYMTRENSFLIIQLKSLINILLKISHSLGKIWTLKPDHSELESYLCNFLVALFSSSYLTSILSGRNNTLGTKIIHKKYFI